ncbi:MAG: hypothetical protein WCP06_07060 [Verrucomicrobiota bacterium]
MKPSTISTFVLALGASTLFQAGALAAAPNAYQVTGPVVSVDQTKIVVQKGKENWELARTAETKINGGTADQLKPGVKVTIHYTMSATNVEIKPEKAGKAAAAKTSPAPVGAKK